MYTYIHVHFIYLCAYIYTSISTYYHQFLPDFDAKTCPCSPITNITSQLSYHSYVKESFYIYAGRLDKIAAAWEMIAQFIGALCGGILLKISLPHT